MKNQRAYVMMGVAVLFGLAAVVMAWKWKNGQDSSSMKPVVVATADVHRGQRLTSDMLKVVKRPLDQAGAAASFSDPVPLTERVLKANLVKDEVVTEAKLAPAGTLGGLSALISEGKRAITVRVNDVIGVAGFALPGNFVDIIVHTQRDPAEGESRRNADHVSKIVLERILVLAVAQEVSRDETKPKVVNAVTLEVTPQQAEHLDLARGVGTLSLALRNQVDSTLPETGGATKMSLLEDEEAAKLAAARAALAAKPVVKVASTVRRPAAALKPALRVKPTDPSFAERNCVTVLNGLQPSKECF